MKDIINKIRNNQIGIIPHDTVPGIIACMNEKNAKRIIDIKKRDQTKGFIILIPNTDHLAQLVTDIPNHAKKLIAKFWPGPLTIIFNKQPSIPTIISGFETTIAIRYPKHPLLNQILIEINEPLITTSANISTEINLSKELINAVDFCDNSIHQSVSIESTQASTIINCTTSTPTIIRQGSINQEVLTGLITS